MNSFYGCVSPRDRLVDLGLAKARMSRSLTGPVNECDLQNGVGFIGADLPLNGTGIVSLRNVTSVIEGKPVWMETKFARTAAQRGDAVALSEAYEEHGVDFLKLLSGAYALAVIDTSTKKTILAVDRFGIRPLCYAVGSDSCLIFGSTIDAIRSSQVVDDSICQQSIFSYLYFHVVPSPETIFSGIFKIEPGQCIEFDGRELKKNFYWYPDFKQETEDHPDALAKSLFSEIDQAVARCSPNSTSATFLSGGLDSSTVSGIAQSKVDGDIRAYSIGFSQEGYDEMEFARIAAKKFGLDLHEYYVTPTDVADTFDLIVKSFGEPFGNSSAIPAYACANLAQGDGVTKMLAGDGGDEIFAGNERYATQQLFARYSIVPKLLRDWVIEPLAFNLPTNWSKVTRKARRYIEQARTPMPQRLQDYNYLNRYPSGEVFHTDFLQQIDILCPVRAMQEWYGRKEGLSLVDNMLYFDWKLTLADNDLRKVNRMCDVSGVAVEYPFLDHELVEFSMRIPASLKLRNRDLRHFFKRAMVGFLPNEILTKRKHGFGLPFGEWLNTSQELRNHVLPHLDNLKDRRIIRAEHIEKLKSLHANEHAGYYGNMIWVLCVLEKWLDLNT